MSKITVESKLFGTRIEQTTSITKVLELETEQIQQALIKLGWQSPEKTAEVMDLLSLARRQLKSRAPHAALMTIENIINNASCLDSEV